MKHNLLYEHYKSQHGGDWHVFRGPQYQRGAGFGAIFRSLARFVRPIARSIIPLVKKAAPVVGREILSAGKNIFQDVASGERSFGDSAKAHLEQAGQNLTERAVEKVSQLGSGYKRLAGRRKRQTTFKNRPKRSRADIFQ